MENVCAERRALVPAFWTEPHGYISLVNVKGLGANSRPKAFTPICNSHVGSLSLSSADKVDCEGDVILPKALHNIAMLFLSTIKKVHGDSLASGPHPFLISDSVQALIVWARSCSRINEK